MYTKYFVTGATGFLGRAVTRRLLTKTADIYALVMKGDPLAADLPDGIRVCMGDVCDPSSLDAFLEGADGESCVIHCAGIVSVASRPGEQLYNVNVGGTKNIIDACISHGVGKLVYVSSVHALAENRKASKLTLKPMHLIRTGSSEITPKAKLWRHTQFLMRQRLLLTQALFFRPASSVRATLREEASLNCFCLFSPENCRLPSRAVMISSM